MQVNPQEVSAEKATTAEADLRLVSVEQLKKIHRELDACQKVIWLAGCGQRGYGFDPSYVIGAQEQLKVIEELLDLHQPAQSEGKSLYLVWNPNRCNGVVFEDRADAVYASTGRYPSTLANFPGVDSLADYFRDDFEDDNADDAALPLVEISADIEPKQGTGEQA